MAQHAILRFEKHKGHPAGPLEARHERTQRQLTDAISFASYRKEANE